MSNPFKMMSCGFYASTPLHTPLQYFFVPISFFRMAKFDERRSRSGSYVGLNEEKFDELKREIRKKKRVGWPTGVEPATPGITIRCSTNWAMATTRRTPSIQRFVPAVNGIERFLLEERRKVNLFPLIWLSGAGVIFVTLWKCIYLGSRFRWS